jgi:hypothetical protein
MVQRTAIHRRQVVYDAFVRDDGLFDLEGRLTDTRTYDSVDPDRRPIPTGRAVHDIVIAVTVTPELEITAISSVMTHVPVPECHDTQAVLQRLVGKTMGRGWRKTINEAMGGVQGCTHMRELLFNMATAAYQAVPIYVRFNPDDLEAPFRADQPPPHLGQCMTWGLSSAPVKRAYPQFYIAPEPSTPQAQD